MPSKRGRSSGLLGFKMKFRLRPSDIGVLISRPSKLAVLFACVVSAFVSVAAHSQAQVKVTLDGRGTGLKFEGLGAVSAGASSRLLIDYPEPERSQILDYLFKPGYGAALQDLKVEIGSDVNSTDGSEPSHMRSRGDSDYTRGYEWWLMTEARKRNPKIIFDALPWGAPGWIGEGHIFSDDMADYVADFLEAAARIHHINVQYVGIWNERMYNSDYVKRLHAKLSGKHLQTKIVCCDSYPGIPFGEWDIVVALSVDPDLKSDIAAIGVHYPRERNAPPSPDTARALGIPLWSSEDQPNPGSGPFVSRDWQVGGRILARQYIDNYLEDRFTKTEIWSPVTSYYDLLAAPNSGLMYANTPWSGHYEVQGAIWATAHTTQFTEPGWQYLDAASGHLPNGGAFVSLRSPNRRDWSVILNTIGATKAQTVAFRVKGGLSTGDIYVWETNDTRIFERVAVIAAQDGSFSYTFDPDSLYSLTTTTGQGKGTAVPPPDKPFPFPYVDTFDDSTMGRAARFLADQDGAFEVQSCRGRNGLCLEQVVTRKPIPWAALPDPFTIAGDVRWTDYALSADVQIPTYGSATLMARIDSSDVFKDRTALYPSGYIFRVSRDGHWELLSTRYRSPTATLASGVTSDMGRGWHHLQLACYGATIEATIDARPMAKIKDFSHKAGMIALGADWSRVQFDNLSVEPNSAQRKK